jgi:hypothetical protein
MPKCPNCGNPVEWIEFENGSRVADDCICCHWGRDRVQLENAEFVPDTDDVFDRYDD